MENPRPPLPPFDAQSAKTKVRAAENGWNNRNPEAVSLAYSPRQCLEKPFIFYQRKS